MSPLRELHVHLLMGTLALGACGCGGRSRRPVGGSAGPDAAGAFAERAGRGAGHARGAARRDAGGWRSRAWGRRPRRARAARSARRGVAARGRAREPAQRRVASCSTGAAAVTATGTWRRAWHIDCSGRRRPVWTRAPVADGEALGRPLRRQVRLARTRRSSGNPLRRCSVWFAISRRRAAQARLVMDWSS